AITYLAGHAQRAHPQRDRQKGRLQLGLEPLLESNDLIEFSDAALVLTYEKLVYHSIQKEHTMKIDKLPFPRKNGIFGFGKGASCSIEPHTFRACLDHVPDHAHRSFQTFHEGLFRLREIDRTGITFVNDAATMILCGIGRMI